VFTKGSTNLSHARAFENAGCEVIRYSYRERAHELGSEKRDAELIDECRKNSCDLVVLSKCNGLGESVVSGCQGVGAKVVLWYMDPLWNFTPEIEKRVAACDVTFCALAEPFAKAQEIAPDKAHFLQEGYDPDVDRPFVVDPVYDVSFIGSLGHSEKRLRYAQEVKFKVITGVYGDEHAKVVCMSRINLNFTHGGTSDRTYKVLAAGGFLLTEPWPDMEKDFEVGADLDTFSSPQELKEKIEYWLTHEDKRFKIRLHGMETVRKFSRDAWARRILETI